MDYKDYYSSLGLPKTATQKEISKAYKKLARKYHPDLNQGDKQKTQKFQEINEANEVLGDADNRKKYDKYGKDWKHADEIEKAQSQRGSNVGGGFGGNSYSSYGGASANQGDFSDFFSQYFQEGTRSDSYQQNVRFRGQDLQAALSVKLTDIQTDQQQVLTIGAKKVRVTIPAGVEDGHTLKLTGQGQPGVNGGPAGDLLVKFNVNNDTGFKRLGANLYADQKIDLLSAVLGGEMIVETMTTKVKVKIAPGTQNDHQVRLKGKGSAKYRSSGQFGDLIVKIKVEIPTELSEQETSLYRQIQELSS